MSNKTITLTTLLFALIVAGMFLFTYLSKTTTPEPVVPLPPATTTAAFGITRIEGKHFFIDGVHTIVGEVLMPTPCDLLTTESVVAESYPEQVTFAFSVVNTTDSCAQVVTSQRFKVEATASKLANLKATFMGQSVELNLTEATLGETPESFELFIKG